MNVRPPVDAGDKLVVDISVQAPDGRGIAKIDDYVIFVDKAKAGTKVKVLIKKCARTYADAIRIE